MAGGGIKQKFSSDRKSVTLVFDEPSIELDADELITLIVVLAGLREEMEPAVAADFREADIGSVRPLTNPRWASFTDAFDENVFFALRSEGLGWITARIPPDEIDKIIAHWTELRRYRSEGKSKPAH